MKHDRCKAVWRNGDGWNVALNDAKGTYYDHARGEGGGILDFIALVSGGTRKEAIEWLAAFTGMPLRGWNHDERREWARRMDAAAGEAEELMVWKWSMLESLRYERVQLLKTYHGAKRFITSHDVDECEARQDIRFDMALDVGWICWPRIRKLDKWIDRLAQTTYSELLPYFRARKADAA